MYTGQNPSGEGEFAINSHSSALPFTSSWKLGVLSRLMLSFEGAEV